jgi:hypothetical protein
MKIMCPSGATCLPVGAGNEDNVSELNNNHYCNLYTYHFSCCFQAIVCIIIMFSINWIYSFVEISVAAIIYVYIGQASPG